MTDQKTDPTPAAPAAPAKPTVTVPPGARVTSRHAPEWGKGVVMGREGRLVRVLFMAHPGRKPVVVSPASLIVEEVKNWPDNSRDMGPVSTPSKKKEKPAKPPEAVEPTTEQLEAGESGAAEKPE